MQLRVGANSITFSVSMTLFSLFSGEFYFFCEINLPSPEIPVPTASFSTDEGQQPHDPP